MRIGIDIRTLMDKHYSGIPEYSYKIIKNILEIDKENEYVLFYNSWKNISDSLPDFKKPNVSYYRTKFPNKIFNYILQKTLKWPKIDKLLEVDVFFMPHINFIALSNKVKKIVTVHDLSFVMYPEYFSLRKNIWHKSIGLEKMLASFDKIISVSKNTKNDIVKYLGIDKEKIEVIYSGIPSEYKNIDVMDKKINEVRDEYNLNKPYIFYLGNIEPRKNILGLIKAFESLLENSPRYNNYELIIAGAKGWKYKKIVKYWQNSKIKDKIRFLGYINSDDKKYLYNLASVFVYPSFYEGFGFPPLEAIVCGTPVITSANSSLAEILGQSALYVDAKDVVSIELAMKEVLDNNKLKEKILKDSQKFVEKYNWMNTAEQVYRVFEGT
ncbi:hypothetical protein C0583_02440 [Candidatus Parcubacteria bacterium]|nr:MAG: hypothetical protein C0583_02440 [Candidatus Parcubacteria bacterium]